jgi:hypothetical protein
MKKASRTAKATKATKNTLYSYVNLANKAHALKQRAIFGTSSKYIDFLIAKDRGQKVKRPTIAASK